MSKIDTDLPSEVLAVLAEALGFRLSYSHAPGDDEWVLSRGHGPTHIQHVGTRAAVCAFLTGYSVRQLHTAQILNELENTHKAEVPQQSTESLDLTGRIRWLAQAHQEARRILGELAKLLGHSEGADASLIQRVIDNQKVEDGIRRRLEDERTSWETKCNDARDQVAILERQLNAARCQVKILEQQLEEDRDKTRL